MGFNELSSWLRLPGVRLEVSTLTQWEVVPPADHRDHSGRGKGGTWEHTWLISLVMANYLTNLTMVLGGDWGLLISEGEALLG